MEGLFGEEEEVIREDPEGRWSIGGSPMHNFLCIGGSPVHDFFVSDADMGASSQQAVGVVSD
jgi:hypothetical protein